MYGYRAREDSKSYIEPRDEQACGIINSKLDWLLNNLDDSFLSIKYYIWGADISGKVAKDILEKRLKNGVCLGFIDPIKTGKFFCNMQIKAPEQLEREQFDYVFICSQAGAVMARKFLSDLGKREIYNYFKLS